MPQRKSSRLVFRGFGIEIAAFLRNARARGNFSNRTFVRASLPEMTDPGPPLKLPFGLSEVDERCHCLPTTFCLPFTTAN